MSALLRIRKEIECPDSTWSFNNEIEYSATLQIQISHCSIYSFYLRLCPVQGAISVSICTLFFLPRYASTTSVSIVFRIVFIYAVRLRIHLYSKYLFPTYILSQHIPTRGVKTINALTPLTVSHAHIDWKYFIRGYGWHTYFTPGEHKSAYRCILYSQPDTRRCSWSNPTAYVFVREVSIGLWGDARRFLFT